MPCEPLDIAGCAPTTAIIVGFMARGMTERRSADSDSAALLAMAPD
jgi:hypothetical protein